jgi:hypothetical protein
MKTEAARIAPELLERGVRGSLKKLLGMAGTQVDDLGKQIRVAYEAATGAGKKLDGGKLANALESLKTPFRAVGASGDDVALNPQAIKAIEELQGVLRELGSSVSPSTIWKFRQSVDDVVAGSNGFTRELPRASVKTLQKKVRHILQTELTRAVPRVERLNREFRLWKGLQDVANATIKRRTSQEGSLIPAILGAGGATVGAATGGLVGAGGGALLAAQVARAMRSPLWRTFSATQKHSLAGYLSGAEEVLTGPGRQLLTLFTLAASGASSEALKEPTGPQLQPQP